MALRSRPAVGGFKTTTCYLGQLKIVSLVGEAGGYATGLFHLVESGRAETSRADMARLPMRHSPKAGHSKKFGSCVYGVPGLAVNLRIVWISLSW